MGALFFYFFIHVGTMANILVGEAEQAYITAGAQTNVRGDGRQRGDIRRVDIQLGVIPNATGSARVRIGGTDIIVAAKADIGQPRDDRPDAGLIKFHVECSPVASPAFRGRGGEELGSELARSLERSFYVGPTTPSSMAPIDLTALKIVSGKTCWILYIDALVLDLDGAALDATSIAVKAALTDCAIPKVEIVPGSSIDDEPELEVDDDPETALRLDVSRVPLYLTVCLLGPSTVLIDPTAEEEESSQAQVQVAVDGRGTVCGITKRREEAIETGMVMEMIALAQQKGRQLHTSLHSFFATAAVATDDDDMDT